MSFEQFCRERKLSEAECRACARLLTFIRSQKADLELTRLIDRMFSRKKKKRHKNPTGLWSQRKDGEINDKNGWVYDPGQALANLRRAEKAEADLVTAKELLYQTIVELEYVQSVENCNSGLCASSLGRELIERGMKLLGVKDLSGETLAKSKRDGG